MQALLLSACSGTEYLDQLADSHALLRDTIHVEGFELAMLGRPLPAPVKELRVYLGSDGRPWINDRPAADPTGNRSLAIEMMLRDPMPALYLGRPCYHGSARNPPCEPGMWTSGRYSEIVVNAVVAGLLEIMARYRPRQLTLVGYSGGGTLAVLAASRLPAQTETLVITVAANLDPEAWTRFHGLLPLSDSLNPVFDVPSPAGFRQLHLVGTADERVPPQTIRRYVERHPEGRLLEVEGFGHVCCWVQHWQELVEK